MAKRAQLSKGELTVARAVWRLEEGTVGLIHQEVCRNTEMDYATVQTYLRRLEAKDYLRVRREGRNKVYSAKVRASKVIRDTVHDLVERLFDGEVVAMVNHLVRDHKLSGADLEQLRSLLAELEGNNDES